MEGFSAVIIVFLGVYPIDLLCLSCYSLSFLGLTSFRKFDSVRMRIRNTRNWGGAYHPNSKQLEGPRAWIALIGTLIASPGARPEGNV